MFRMIITKRERVGMFINKTQVNFLSDASVKSQNAQDAFALKSDSRFLCHDKTATIPADLLASALQQKMLPVRNALTFKSEIPPQMIPVKNSPFGDVWRIKHSSIKNLLKVGDNLYKGSAPFKEQDVQFIKNTLGAKTILSFVTHKEMLDFEKKWTEANNIRFINVQLESPYDLLKEEKFNEIKEVLQNKDLGPVYIHCDIGMTRSVGVIGMYRLLNGADLSAVQKELPVLSNVYKDQKLNTEFLKDLAVMVNKHNK